MIEFSRESRRTQRDWREDRKLTRTDYDTLVNDLDGEPTGDWILIPETVPEGSETRVDEERWRLVNKNRDA